MLSSVSLVRKGINSRIFPLGKVATDQGEGYAVPMSQSTIAGRLFLVGIGLMLALAGGVFVALMWRSYQRAERVIHWPEVQAIVLQSEVEERQIPGSAPEFRFDVLYGYEWQGKDYTSEQYSLRGSKWSSRKDEAEELVKEFPASSQIKCRVDPDNPSHAVLKRESKGPLYSIWFPAIFVVGGLGIAVRAIMNKPQRAKVEVA